MRARATLPVVALVAALVLAALPAGTAAQDAAPASPPELWLVPRGDSVLLHVPLAPLGHDGFVVYRAPAAEDAAGELLTPEPVEPLRQPVLAAEVMGPDYPRVQALMRTTEPGATWRAVQADAFTAHAMASLFPSVGRALGRIWMDTTAVSGARYRYRVVFVDLEGEETDSTRTGTVTVEEAPIRVPQGLEAETGNVRVTLTWSFPPFTGEPGDHVVGFHVERADGGGEFRRVTATPVAREEVAGPRWTDPEVSNGVTYRYRVRAVDLAGRSSEPSSPVEATPVDPSPPVAPTDVTTEAGDGRVVVRWRLSPDGRVAGYAVERAEGGIDAPFTRLFGTDSLVPLQRPTVVDTTVAGGIRYYYRVVAVTADGRESRPSTAMAAVPVDRTPPAAPGEARVVLEDGRRLRVSWSPSPSGDVVGYHLYRGESDDRMGRLTSEPLADTLYLDSGFGENGLAPGQGYRVRVTAVDGGRNESMPVVVDVTVPDDEAPAAVRGLRAESFRGRWARIRWGASPANDVAVYRVVRTDVQGDTLLLPGPAAGEVLEARDTAAVAGATYRYQVLPVDTAGNAGPAAEVELHFRDPTPPPAPRHATASMAETGGVVVTWERVVARDLAGYRVFRAATPTGVLEPVSDLLPADGERRFVHAEGEGTRYYAVRAVDTSGNESDASPVARPAGGMP